MTETKKNQQNLERGFSLIELLTSMTIIVILTSLFVANFHAQGTKTAVNSATSILISDLHKISAESLASRDISVGHPASRYAVTLANAASTYNLVGYDNSIPSVQSTLSTSNIGSNVSVSSILITKPDSSTATPSSLTIGFKVPYGKVVLNYTGSLTDEVNDIAQIKLISSDNSICSYVSVNGITGNISTQTTCP